MLKRNRKRKAAADGQGWMLEIRYRGQRLGLMAVPSYEEALGAVKEYGGLFSEIQWPDGTSQYSNNIGHSLLIWPVL
jgi:hypothetical protein